MHAATWGICSDTENAFSTELACTSEREFVTHLTQIDANELTHGAILVLKSRSLTNGNILTLASNGTQLRQNGVIMHVDADSQVSGTMFDIPVLGLVNGSAVKITSGDKIMELETGATSVLDGVGKVVAASMTSGVLKKVVARRLENGVGMEVTTRNGRRLLRNSSLVNLEGGMERSGSILNVGAQAMVGGVGAKVVGHALTAGSLVYVQSGATNAGKGIVRTVCKGELSSRMWATSVAGIESGTVVDIRTVSDKHLFSGRVISVVAGENANGTGTIARISDSSISRGRLVSIKADKLTTGRAIRVVATSPGSDGSTAVVDLGGHGIVAGSVLKQ